MITYRSDLSKADLRRVIAQTRPLWHRGTALFGALLFGALFLHIAQAFSLLIESFFALTEYGAFWRHPDVQPVFADRQFLLSVGFLVFVGLPATVYIFYLVARFGLDAVIHRSLVINALKHAGVFAEDVEYVVSEGQVIATALTGETKTFVFDDFESFQIFGRVLCLRHRENAQTMTLLPVAPEKLEDVKAIVSTRLKAG